MNTSLIPLRRKHLAQFLLAAVLASGLGHAQAQTATNVLTNPGFEAGGTGGAGTPIPGWTGYYNYAIESTNALVYQSTSNVLVHGGIQTMKVWGGFQGGDTYCGAYQDVPAASDSVWSGDIWVLSHVDDRLSGQNQVWLEVSFRNSASPNTPLQTYTSLPFTNNSPANTWVNLVVTDGAGSTNLTAPFGTSFARFQLVFKQIGGTYDGGSIYVDDAKLIKTSGADPEITVHPVAQTKVYSQSVTFSVTANGKSSLSYQWQRDGVNLVEGGRISGSQTAILTITGLTGNDMGFYSVNVTDNAGKLSSDAAYLTVQDPGILTEPVAVTKLTGETASLTVTAASSSALSYQWFKNLIPVADGGRVSGAKTATLTIANLDIADGGNYSVDVTSLGGTISSATAKLSVKTPADMANRVQNPSFEEGLAPWTGFGGNALENTGMLVYNSPSTYAPAHSGTNVFKTYGSGAWNGVFQDVPVKAGEIFTASAWARTEAEDMIGAPNECWLELQFLNAGGNMIGLYKSPSVTATTPASTWVALEATNMIAFWGDYSIVSANKYLVAPAGATAARVQITYHATGGSGSVYADDLKLMVKIPVTIQAARVGNSVNLTFPTQGATSYRVMYKSDLGAAAWELLTTVAGDGTVKTVSDSIAAAPRFYVVFTE